MGAIIIDGKRVADGILKDIQKSEKTKKDLAIISVGNDSASEVYVRNKIRACSKCNIISHHICLPENVKESVVAGVICRLNQHPDVGGIILQMPVPEHLNAMYLINQITPEKDVDGLSLANRGGLYTGQPGHLPCTAVGVLKLIDSYGIETRVKHVVIIGRSELVGRPLSVMLSNKFRDATVTLCNSHTTNLKELCLQADILISAIGKPKFITADMVKPGVVVIDVGINKDENGKLCGDVDFENIEPKASAITPVPGGVGPMTVAMLINHLPVYD